MHTNGRQQLHCALDCPSFSACSLFERFKAYLYSFIPKWFLFCISAEPRSPPSSDQVIKRKEIQSVSGQ